MWSIIIIIIIIISTITTIIIIIIIVVYQMQGIEVKVVVLNVDVAITAHCRVSCARWYNQFISLIPFGVNLLHFRHEHGAYHNNSLIFTCGIVGIFVSVLGIVTK